MGKWILPDGTEIHIDTPYSTETEIHIDTPYLEPLSEDSVSFSWYARDFLEFVTCVLWHAYPSLQPLIKRASSACWRVWQEEAQEYYKSDNLPNTILKPIGMLRTQRSYGSVLNYYLSDLRGKLQDLLNGMFDGSFHEINDGE